jgi:hypothetical protein
MAPQKKHLWMSRLHKTKESVGKTRRHEQKIVLSVECITVVCKTENQLMSCKCVLNLSTSMPGMSYHSGQGRLRKVAFWYYG